MIADSSPETVAACGSKSLSGMIHDGDDLIRLFNSLFADTENTRLIRGNDEPIYLPADGTETFNRVVFAHGFFASALHEISHWCIAGDARRQLVDFGYWYRPDGRSDAEQREFEWVEVKPQALEWILSRAAQAPFRVSLDNLNGESSGSERLFCERVFTQAQQYLRDGLPARAQGFCDALLGQYRPGERVMPDEFCLEALWRQG